MQLGESTPIRQEFVGTAYFLPSWNKAYMIPCIPGTAIVILVIRRVNGMAACQDTAAAVCFGVAHRQKMYRVYGDIQLKANPPPAGSR